MSNDDDRTYQDIIALFEAASGDDPASREDRLAQAPEVVATRVRAMLAAAGGEHDLLDRPIVMRAVASEDAEADEPWPELPGFTIVERIARGGMGVVFAAVEDAPADREVAIKVMRADLPPVLAARFAVEQGLFAQLNHPNIAAVHRAGATADGRPYLVMERVDGRPLLAHCQERKLHLEERITLAEQLLRGVLFCHQRGVVHGDIKPANVLVRRLEDGTDVVKLIDFGVALELAEAEPNGNERPPRMGTPAYMSPEWLAGTAPPDVRSDVYACGVLLSVLARDAPTSGGSSAWTRPYRWIVARATAPDPEERYQSVAEILAEFVRLRENRPLEAGPRSVAYRSRLWLRRHRVGAASAALAGILLVGFVAALVMQTLEIRAQRDAAAQERDTAREVEALLIGMFADSDPYRRTDARPHDAEALLDRGWARIRARQDLAPASFARLGHDLMQAYRGLGAYDRVDEIAAVLLASTALSPEDRIRVRIEAAAGASRSYATERALEHARLAVQLATENPGSDTLRFEARRSLASTLLYADRCGDAIPLHRELAVEAGRRFGHRSGDRSILLNDLGYCLVQAQQNAEAIVVLEEALAIKLALPEHPVLELATTRQNLALGYSQDGRHQEAVDAIERTLAARRDQLGAEHPEVLNSLENQALIFSNGGRLAESLAVLERATPMVIALHGEGSLVHARHLNTKGFTLDELGRLDEAFALRTRLAALVVDELPDNRYMVGLTAFNLASTAAKLAQFDVAETQVAVADSAFGDVLSVDDPVFGIVQTLTAKVHIARERHREARDAAERAVAILDARFDATHWRHALASAALAYASWRIDGSPDAARALAEAHEVLATHEPPRQSDAELVAGWLATAR